MRTKLGWYITFCVLVTSAFVGISFLTGQDAIGAASRFIWNVLVLGVNTTIRLVGNVMFILAKGVGFRRVSRLATLLTHVGLGYAGSLVLSDARLRQAQGWRGKLKAAITLTRNRWQRLHLVWKLAIVATLVASQLYLHFLLIVFPIAFLVPIVQRLWVQAADLLFGSWYWQAFGHLHRKIVATLKAVPGWQVLVDIGRLWRIRCLCAWRLWKYDVRYRVVGTETRVISLREPLRLWWDGELDRYVGRPLLAGPSRGGMRAGSAAIGFTPSMVQIAPTTTARAAS